MRSQSGQIPSACARVAGPQRTRPSSGGYFWPPAGQAVEVPGRRSAAWARLRRSVRKRESSRPADHGRPLIVDRLQAFLEPFAHRVLVGFSKRRGRILHRTGAMDFRQLRGSGGGTAFRRRRARALGRRGSAHPRPTCHAWSGTEAIARSPPDDIRPVRPNLQ